MKLICAAYSFKTTVGNMFFIDTLKGETSLSILNLTNMEGVKGASTCAVSPRRPTGNGSLMVQKSPPDSPDRRFPKNNSAAVANFEVGGIPFSGRPSNASGLLETHSHPLRQTLINLCAQV